MKGIVAALVVVCLLGLVKADPPVLYTVQSVNGTTYATTPPYVVGNYAYVGGDNGYIYAQNITAGWGIRASMSLNLNSTTDPKVIFNISGTTFGVVQGDRVICLGLDLSVKWVFDANYTLNPSYTSRYYTFNPVVWNNTVFIGSYSNNVHAVDATTGMLKWTTQLASDANKQLAVCPVLKALFCPSSSYVYALSTATGVQMWRTAGQSYTIQTIFYDDDQALVYAGQGNGNYLIFNATNNGTLLKTLSSPGSGNAYVQPVKYNGIVYLASGTYLTAYNTTSGTGTTGPQFTVGGYSATIQYWTWAMGSLWIQAETYDTGLYMVAPNASWVEWFKSDDGTARGLTYVNGYFIFSASYAYLIPTSMGPVGENYIWATSYSYPLTTVYSPLNNGTLLVANSGSVNLLTAVPLNTMSAAGAGIRFSTQNSISSTNIAVNGSVAYTCDYYYRCYGVNGTGGNGTTVRVSDTSMSSYGGVALTYNNLFSARGYYMASMSVTSFTTLAASGSDGAAMSSTARYPTVVGTDGNIYQSSNSNAFMFNGLTGELMKTIAQSPDNQLAMYKDFIYLFDNTKFYAYTTKTSSITPVWTKTNTESNNYYSAPMVYGGNVYIGDYFGYTYCYGRESGALLWHKRVSSSNDQVYYLDSWNGYVFAYTSTFVTIYNMNSGVSMGIATFSGSFNYQPLITPDGTLVAYTNKMQVIDLNTMTYRYNSTAFSPSSSYPPVFINGALYWTTGSSIYATNAYTGDILFVIPDGSGVSARSMAASWDNQTIWYGAGSNIKAAPIGIASRYVTAKPAVNGNAPTSDKDKSEKSKLWIIGVVVAVVVVIVIIVIVKSKSGGSAGDGQKDNNYVSMQQPVNSGV